MKLLKDYQAEDDEHLIWLILKELDPNRNLNKFAPLIFQLAIASTVMEFVGEAWKKSMKC